MKNSTKVLIGIIAVLAVFLIGVYCGIQWSTSLYTMSLTGGVSVAGVLFWGIIILLIILVALFFFVKHKLGQRKK